MAKIGNLGSLIVFEVSSEKVITFNNMKQTVKGRWASHTPIGGKPIPEFLGADQRGITFDIYLSSVHGIKPRSVMEEIEDAVENGTPLTLVIGGRKVGSNQWVITDMSEAWEEIIEDGRLVSASLTITIAEYR